MNIIIQPRAKKELKAFPKLVTGQILKKLYSIRDEPLGSIEKLKGYSLWKLRIGDYRVILYVDTGKQNIHVIKVGHRKNVYKRL